MTMNRCFQQASRNVREQGWLQGKGGAAVALEQQDAPGLIAGSAGGHRVMVSCHGTVPIRSFPDLGTKSLVGPYSERSDTEVYLA